VRILKLDEWCGLAMEDPATCERYLRDWLVDGLQMGDRYVGFDSRPADPEAECRRVAGWLARNGPIDTCVLGLGVNGHIGFNEPGPSLRRHAHVARLSEASLGHAMLERARGRPTCGLTLGMADVLHAGGGLLLVSGAAKQAALRRLLDGPISTDFPASLLALHRNLQVLCDVAAFPEADSRKDQGHGQTL
jgi:galactosamine-6-phosphate isomerase